MVAQWLRSASAQRVALAAAFTQSANRLAASFDGTTSSDTDGTIASYDWDFGDGTTGTGATANHNYAAEGTYTVKLKVTDNSGGTNEVSHDITVTDPNALPTAAFTSSTTDLTASLNGSTSSDPDGTIASYEWDFGDGTTGSGATIDHGYAAAGTYDVKLTVTDNRGANRRGHAFGQGDCAEPGTCHGRLRSHPRQRLGYLDQGWCMDWYRYRKQLRCSWWRRVDDRSAGATRTQSLNSVNATSTDTTVDVALNRPDAGSTYVSVIGRRVNATDDYRVKLRVFANDVNATLVKNVRRCETTLSGGRVISWSTRPTTCCEFASGFRHGTTALKTKVWRAMTPRPSRLELRRRLASWSRA